MYASSSINKDEVKDAIVFHMGFNENLKDFYLKISKDPLLREAPLKLKGMRLRSTSLFNALLIAICQQNASFKQGWRILMNLYSTVGLRASIENFETIIPPRPEQIANLNLEVLRKMGVGYRAYVIIEAAKAFCNWEINRLADAEYVEKYLLSIKGVGQYTARLALLLGLRIYSKPPIDRWTSRIISELYSTPLNVEAVEKLLIDKWGLWAGLGVYFLTITLDAVPLSKALERIRRGYVSPSLNGFTPLTLWRL